MPIFFYFILLVRASESAQNSSRVSRSPLILGSIPQDSIISVKSCFDISENPVIRELGRVFLLCSNDAFTVLKNTLSSSGRTGNSLCILIGQHTFLTMDIKMYIFYPHRIFCKLISFSIYLLCIRTFQAFIQAI